MQASPELRNIIAKWFNSVTRGDISWPDLHVSRHAGVRLIGTDPSEMLQGAQVAKFLRDEALEIGGIIKILPGEIEAYQEGTVGWGLARPIVTLPDGNRFSPRWSAVFHQEDGVWKLVQLHASIGIANEDVLDPERSGETAVSE